MFEWASQEDWVYYTKSRFTQTLPKKITSKNKFIFEIGVEHSEAIKWKIRVGPFIKLVLHLPAQNLMTSTYFDIQAYPGRNFFLFQNDSDAKQEDLETAFLRKDGIYNFTRNGQEFRLQFFMNPMCEKSFRPYSKKIVRRRPEFRSPDDIRKLTKGNEVPKYSWFSLRRVFWWR